MSRKSHGKGISRGMAKNPELTYKLTDGLEQPKLGPVEEKPLRQVPPPARRRRTSRDDKKSAYSG